jgi:acyl carrier protein
VETVIASIWCEVLGRRAVGARDHFFDLGGHSLLILKVQAALQREFQREIPVVELFSHPTIADLAEWISRGEDRVAAASDDAAARGLRQRSAQARRKPIPAPAKR